MAKKANRKILKEKQAPVPVTDKTNRWYSNRMELAVMGAILLLTLLVYLPCLSNTKEFTNWDDNAYVTQQPLITALDGSHIKGMFTEPVCSHYHPLTILSLALNYQFSQLHPFGYFLTNIIFHLLNTLLVFIFLYRLSGKKFWIGAISTLLFAIHPMHVESVAWISERKDVLYCFFFLLSCISYLSYSETGKMKYAIICFVLFVLSCLSKAMAVPLPIVLLLIDYYRERKFAAKMLLEKIPFFAVSLGLGLLAIHTQKSIEINDIHVFTIPQRIIFTSYEIFMYCIRLFLPVGLSAIYPHPVVRDVGGIDWIYRLMVPAVLVMLIAPAVIFYKKDKKKFRVFVFGTGFFMVMVAMVLRLMVVGHSIMPDRYTYVSYIGLFFVLASFLQPYLDKPKTKTAAFSLVLVACAALAIGSYERVKVWNDSESLWTDVIIKHPYIYEQNGNIVHMSLMGIEEAYSKRANYFRERGEMDKSMADYALLVRFKSKDDKPYSCLANFYGLKGQYDTAIALYDEALKINPDNYETLHNRALTYSYMGKHQQAIQDFLNELQLNPPDSIAVLQQIAMEKLKARMYEASIADCNKLLAINTNNAPMLSCRGLAFLYLEKYPNAIIDLSKTLNLNPKSGVDWYNLSFAYSKLGNKAQALSDALMAKKNGFRVDDRYLNSLQ